MMITLCCVDRSQASFIYLKLEDASELIISNMWSCFLQGSLDDFHSDFYLLNYMPHVLSCSTCSHASRVSCRMCSLALRVSWSTCSRAHSASCPTCSRALGASYPTCSCVWRASYCTYPVLYVPRASRFLSPFFLLYVLILPFVLLSFHAPRSYFSVHLLLVIFFGKFIKVKTNVVHH